MKYTFAIRIVAYMLAAALSTAACAPAAQTPPEGATGVEAGPTRQPTTPAPTVSVPTLTPGPAQPTATRTPTAVPPSPTPTRPPATSTVTPTPTPQRYTIKAGDTLLGIALELGTTVEALMAANDLSNTDILQIGQQLIIPTLPVESPDQEASPTGEATPAATGEGANLNLATATPIGAIPSAANAIAAPPPPSPTRSGPPLPTISHPANINPLTGLPVDDPAVLQRRPLLVRVGNDVGARPQVGLNSADVVYEEITEWWLTRFTAIFLSETPTTVAPIRSARLINIQLGPQYQGALAHSGGSDPVRWEISQAPIVNLDEFYSPQPYFYRPNQGWQTRLAIDTRAARDYMVSKGTEAAVSLQGFLFSDTINEGELAESVYIPYPRATSFTEWHYDPAGGKYLRWINGSPLYDFNGGQVAAANVIVYFAEHRETEIVEDSNGATSIRIIVNGRGPAWFFRDGKLNKGYWQTDGSRPPYFTHEDGQPYHLKPGNTWVELAPTYYTIGLNSADEASARK